MQEKTSGARGRVRRHHICFVTNEGMKDRGPNILCPQAYRGNGCLPQHQHQGWVKARPPARVAGRWSTPGLEEAMEGYRGATAAARSAVRGALRGLTASLAPDAAGLVGACAFSVIASALTAHTRAALASGWSLVDVVDGDDEAASHSSPPLAISGAWPYWLDGRDPGTVRNDLSLDGMALLTGPNVSLTSMGRAESGRAGCGVPPRGRGDARLAQATA
jgi:hypothetical protein